jgi:lipoprotein-anchoring transpeptidase ErfK/SrfK
MKRLISIGLFFFPTQLYAQEIIVPEVVVPRAQSERWTDRIDRSQPITIKVDLSKQTVNVEQLGITLVEAPISSGKAGHLTPTGEYKIQGKEPLHWSRRYKAPMPHTLWFKTQSGIALHSGIVPGYPSSHGCIHLPSKFASELYSIARVGDRVIVSQES